MINYGNILESCMLVAFGLAWPANIINSLRVKSSRARTPVFLFIVNTGYVFGVLAKIVSHNVNYVVIFYLINMAMVSFDTYLYFRYRAQDKIKYGKA
ncbi:MAG: hypothetical protein LBF38_05645 [Deltaproteobacteria bacterium]|jgi:hypothetical protein|nr:hypothetical protein [Deltaproteobacteria bacterium]